MNHKLRFTPALVAVLSGLMVIAYAVSSAVREREVAIQNAGLQTQNFARVLEEHARQTLHRVGTTLVQADATLVSLQHKGEFDIARARQMLAALLPADRLLQSFVVIDSTGKVLFSSASNMGPITSSHAESDYFSPHVRGADRELVFGNPFQGSDGEWMLPVSRRIGAIDGPFKGILVAMVRTEFLQFFCDSIDRGEDGLLTLFLTSGSAVVTSPASDTVMGKDWSQTPLFRAHLPAWPTGTARQVVIRDGVERIYSFRALNDYPVVVTYGLALAGVLRPWQHGAWRDGVLVLAALMLLTGAAVKLKRQEAWRRTATRDLKNSEVHLHSIIAAEPECIKIVDAKGRLVQMNPAGLRMIEADSLDQVAGQPVIDLIAPQYRAAFTQLHERVLAGDTVELAFEVMGLRGGRRWLETHAVPFQHDGETMQLAVTRDITQRRESEKTLALTNNRMCALIEAIPDAIFFKDGESRWLITNQSAKQLFQLQSIAWEGKTELELAALHPEFRSAHEACLVDDEKAWQSSGMSLFAETVIDEQGLARHFEVRKIPVFDECGNRQSLVIIGRDITERKQAEEAQRIAATAFESQQGMAITDAQRVILRVNKAFTAISGYSSKEAVGQNPRLLASGRHDRSFYANMTLSLEVTGAWQGEIWNRRKTGEVYPEWLSISAVKDVASVTTHYVAIFTDISDRKTAQAQLETLAFYDPLTLLPNRRLMLDRLDQALQGSTRHARKSALLFVDLDNFKTLNDTLGHFQGDLLLTQVAQRLKTCVREGDTVARLGSDEFVVMLEDLAEDQIEAATHAETVGEKILSAFVSDFSLDQGAHHCTPSIGIALFGGSILESSEQPLKRAELAMFQAKSAGRNTLRFFDGRMQTEVSARAALEYDLREAVLKQQFLLHYQPQVVGGSRITGVEALVRWRHPQRGMVSPAQFIPIAEETGLILPIGQWVLETACAQLAGWANQPALAHLTIAVNVSARQFQRPDFVESVLATLARTRAAPRMLKLELTESMLVDDVEGIIEKMGALKARGVSFALDDFGTGYSSLAYLKRLPLDQLKIDQGFVRNIVTDPNDAAIAKMVLALAESLGLAVIAEGVELQAQADFLAHQGCHAYQGYLFSRPLPLDALEEFVRCG